MTDHIGDANKMVSDTPRMDSVAGHARGIVDAAILDEGMKLERELNAANQRIKRLEEGGDNAVLILHYPDRLAVWNKAKEAKP